jgi:hyperosmotically inducible protein
MKQGFGKTRWIAAATVLAALTACGGTPTRESTGEYIDDTAITARVKAKLATDAKASAREVNVETFKGRVQLSGFASTVEERRHAAAVARTVKGVTEVVNDILIK